MSDLTLKALLFGEDRSMSKSFKQAGGAATKAAKEVGSASQGIKGHVKGLSGALHGDFSGIISSIAGGASMLGPVGMAAGAAITAVGAGLGIATHFGSEAVDTFKGVAGETLRLQRIMGGTAEDASRLRFAFQETGVDADGSAKAIGILSKNLYAASGSHKATAAMVKILGTSFKDAHGNILPMSDLLPKIADRFAHMPAGAEKSALAMKLFGKGGLALLPFLNKGSAGLAELKKKSDEFGLTLSGKDLDALKKSRAAHKDWDAAMEGAKVRIGAQLLPMVTKLVLFFQSKLIPIIVLAGAWVQKHGDQIQRTASMIGHAIVVMVQVWLAWEKVVLTVVMAVARIFGWLWSNAIHPAISFILNGFALLASAAAGFFRALSHVPRFEWAKGAAAAMDRAAASARGLNAGLDKLNGKQVRVGVTVNTYYQTHGSPPAASGKGGNVAPHNARGTRNWPGGWSLVGEEGPEMMYVPKGADIYSHGESVAMARGGSSAGSGASQAPLVVQLMLDGRVVHQALLKIKRQTGQPLQLA